MSSIKKTNANGAGVQSAIPPASRKMVQSLKEIVNRPEPEIYATLKECNMEPNEAVNRLLSQDPFHEVKSKREKKKESKDHTEPRSRSGSNTSNRGNRSTEQYSGRGASTQFRSSDSGALHGKPAYKKENGINLYASSSSAPGVAGHNTYRPPVPSDSMVNENKVSTVSAVDENVPASQPSSGYQPVWVGIPGKRSMADIVKMGKPETKASSAAKSSHNSANHHLTYAPAASELYHDLSSSKGHGSRVSDLHTEPGAVSEDWPLIEPSHVAIMSSGMDSHTDSQLHTHQSNFSHDKLDQHIYPNTDEVEEEEDSSTEDPTVTVSSRNAQEDKSRDASLFDNDMYANMGSYQSHHTYQNEEVADVGASVSSETANLQQLSIQGDDHVESYQEDGPSVVFPSHLQVDVADCSHLSFGSFGSGTGFSRPFASRSSRSNLEETSPDADVPAVIGHSDRNPEYYREESVRTVTDGNLVHSTTAGDGSFESPSASRPETLKQENADPAHVNHYTFPSSSTGYAFDSSQQLNTAFSYSQTSSEMQNLTPFSTAMAYTNATPSTVLVANDAHPVRESELPYSPFPITQSMATTYGSGVSSISSSSISAAEQALKSGFQSLQQPTPQSLSVTGIATGPALPQHLAVHPYSQPTLPLGPFANMIGYPFLPQSYAYMPSGFQQAFAGNSTYHQSLAAVLPQYKNSVSGSNVTQSAAVPSGYGAFGSSSTVPGNFAMNPAAASPAGSTLGYDDILSSQYKDSNHLISLQQNDNSAMWLHGGSRTMSAVPGSTYYSLQGQNQQPGGFRQGQQPSQNYGALGYPNFYHSQTGMTLEHQPQNTRDGTLGGSQGQPKQSQQIWQNSY